MNSEVMGQLLDAGWEPVLQPSYFVTPCEYLREEILSKLTEPSNLIEDIRQRIPIYAAEEVDVQERLNDKNW